MEQFQRSEDEHSVEDEPPDVIGEVESQEFQHQSFMPDCVVCFLNVQKGYVSLLLLT